MAPRAGSAALKSFCGNELSRPPPASRIVDVAPLPPLLQAHFLAPRRIGDPSLAQGTARAENQACGDRLEVGLWADGGRISEVRFRARACSATVAAASLVCEALEGMAVQVARRTDCRGLIASAGGLPQGKAHAADLVARAVAAALADLGARYPERLVEPTRAPRPSVS